MVLIVSAIPFIGWVAGAAELASVPVILALLLTVRRIETRTGIAVHQDQIAKTLGRRPTSMPARS